jgi:hypothetical protein
VLRSTTTALLAHGVVAAAKEDCRLSGIADMALYLKLGRELINLPDGRFAFIRAHFRLWHLSDMPGRQDDVRFQE